MRKSLMLILLASYLGMEAGGAISFAAEEANPEAVASPETVPPQPMRRKMHQPSQRKMHRMQKAGGSAATSTQGQPEGAANPSQRSMRQKLKKAKPTPAPATDNPESR